MSDIELPEVPDPYDEYPIDCHYCGEPIHEEAHSYDDEDGYVMCEDCYRKGADMTEEQKQ